MVMLILVMVIVVDNLLCYFFDFFDYCCNGDDCHCGAVAQRYVSCVSMVELAFVD